MPFYQMEENGYINKKLPQNDIDFKLQIEKMLRLVWNTSDLKPFMDFYFYRDLQKVSNISSFFSDLLFIKMDNLPSPEADQIRMFV